MSTKAGFIVEENNLLPRSLKISCPTCYAVSEYMFLEIADCMFDGDLMVNCKKCPYVGPVLHNVIQDK